MPNPLTWAIRGAWLAQDALRRFLNRHWYCSLGEHRRDQPGVRCKDCGFSECSSD